MTTKYFVLCFLVCAIGQLSEQSPDILADVKLKLQDIGKKISDGYHVAETAVVNEYHKVEQTIKDHPEIWENIENEFDEIGRKMKSGFQEAETAIVKEYNKVETAVEDGFKAIEKSFLDACECKEYSCGCCIHLQQPEIELNATICTNLTYLVHDYGISFTVTVNKFAIFNETVSARNPPPVCLGIPYVKELADVCVRLYDINATTSYLHVCIRIEARMRMILIAKYDLGCINLGPPGDATGIVGAVGTELGPMNNSSGETAMTTQNIQNVWPILKADSDIETPDSTITTDDTFASAKLDEAASAESGSLVIPVLASVGAIILIIIVTLVVYTSIKKKRDEQRALLKFMKRYDSTTSLVQQMDPYC